MAFGSFDRKTSSQPMAEINMVPLIDVVLVLLVIFIVTAPLLTNVVKLDLPKATSAADIQKPEKVEFAIDANGGLFWKGERITREDAIARFAAEGSQAAAARGLPARRPERALPLRRRDPGRRLQGRPLQGRLRQRTGALSGARGPDGQFVAVGIGEVEAAAAGKVVGRFDDAPAGRLDALLDV